MRSSRSLAFPAVAAEAQHQHLCTGRPRRSRQSRAPEDRDRDRRRPGRCWRRAWPRRACRFRGVRPTASRRATAPTPRGAHTAGGTSRGCSAWSRTSGVRARCAPRPLVPVVTHLRQHRHQHVPEQVDRRQDRRQPGDLLVDGDGIVLAQRGDERGGVDRRPSRRSDRRRGGCARRGGEMAQFRSSLSPARRPMLWPCSTASRSSRRRAMSASVYIRPRSSRMGVTAP